MYYINRIPEHADLKKAIEKGIKRTSWFMLTPPISWFGNKAIFVLANHIKKYPSKLSPRQAQLYLGNVIRMQEEIGTGGAGFRYLYAAFLEEAGQIMGREDLQTFSKELTNIGDEWRNFAYSAARIMKARQTDLVSYDELSKLLINIGERERDFFKRMNQLKW